MMPRNSITKEDLKTKVLCLMNKVQHESHSDDAKSVAKRYLNEVLFTIEQYSR
jgi:hypothetical protein